MNNKVVYIIILLFIGTSLSPTMMGLVKNNPKSINYIITETKYLNIEEQKNLRPIEELCKFYDLKIKDQLFYENSNEPIIYQGYFDYTLKGFITDENNGLPIEDATILIISIGKHISFDRDETTTDSTGYYEINLEKIFHGEIIYLVSAEGYYNSNDDFQLYDNEINWINKSLTPGAPAKNSVVNGYVYNADNADPIEGAVVDITWVDNNDHGEWLYTVTDDNGFFSVNVAAGEVMPWVYAEDYYEMYKGEKSVGDGETVEFITHLYPRYPDSAMICGYITEEKSGEPIESAIIELISDNYEFSHMDWNFTFTDADGYYEIMVADSYFQITAMTYQHVNVHSHNDYINEGETYYWDQTLYEIPPQTAKIMGYITNNNTNDSIEEARISCSWYDEQGHYFTKSTMANNLGFYEINIAPGNISIHVSDSSGEYYSFTTDEYMIGEFDTLMLNISLNPYPPKNSVVIGYVYDADNADPIEGAHVYTSSYDENGEYCGGDYIETDNSGFYEIAVAAGEVKLDANADGYYYSYTQKHPIQDGETLQIDILMQPVWLNISIEKPKPGIYFNNQKLIPFNFPIIIGKIDIQVNGSENLYEVEFYINEKFKRADTSLLYTYSWDEAKFGFYNIKLICNGAYDKTEIKNIRVLKLF